jgi:hypothetical protein
MDRDDRAYMEDWVRKHAPTEAQIAKARAKNPDAYPLRRCDFPGCRETSCAPMANGWSQIAGYPTGVGVFSRKRH